MAFFKKNSKHKQKAKIYTVTVIKDHDFDLTEILEWSDILCKNKVFYKKYKNNITFTFNDIDDAFNFKLRWEIA